MPTALVLRATSLRLARRIFVPPQRPLQPRQCLPWRRQGSTMLAHGDREAIPGLPIPSISPQSPRSVPDPAPSRFSPRTSPQDQQSAANAQDIRRVALKKKAQTTTRRRPPVALGKTHITWARVHETPRLGVRPNRFSRDATDHVHEPRPLVRRLRGMHLQWGFLRHQYAESEVLASRRLFNSWKTKFHNIMAKRSAWPYLWHEHGKWLFELDSVPAMRQAWEKDPDMQSRRKAWPSVMLSTLYSCPSKAEMVLEATLDPLPPGYAMLDVLTFIATHLQLDSIKDFRQRTKKADAILHLVMKILHHTPSGHMPFGQRAMGLLARKLPCSHVADLLSFFEQSGHRLHRNTLLQFAGTLASDAPHKATAFGILRHLAETGMDPNGASFKSVVTSLLHSRTHHQGGSAQEPTTTASSDGFSPREALEYLMSRGFSPNHVTATAFLDALCQQSDVDEAIRLALLFAESGVQLDKRAWSTIFRGAKHSLSVPNIIRGFDVAKASSTPFIDVLNNALHAVFYFADAESRETGARSPWILPLFEPLLRLYAQKFDLEPLQRWLPDSLPLFLTQPAGFDDKLAGRTSPYPWRFLQGIVPAVDAFFSSHRGDTRLQPTTTTLAVMLRAYIRTLRQSYDLMAYYAFFKARLEEGEGAQLVRDQGSLIHDTIIMTMTERRGLSRPALQVFGDMLKEHLYESSGGSSGSSPVSSTHIHPPPSLCTFSILVRGLMNKGDRILAEQVMQVMREQGLEPNLITWNTLVKGYATLQDIGKTVETLQDMEAAGFQPDLFTYRAFGKLGNQAKALEMMEGIIEGNRRKAGDMYEWH